MNGSRIILVLGGTPLILSGNKTVTLLPIPHIQV